MPAFDGNRYRKDVLKPLLDGGRSAVDDPFELFDLDLAEDDQRVIQARIDEVVTFWRREQSSPRYRNVVTGLIKDKNALAAQVLNPASRTAARERVTAARHHEATARFQHVDDMLQRLNARWGGIPASRVDRLRDAAARAGVTHGEFDARLAGFQVIADVSDDVQPPPPTVRTLTRTLLAEFSQLNEETPRRTTRTLYEFLGVEQSAAQPSIAAAHDRIGARNRRRRHDRLRTIVDELLALTTDLLINADARIYAAGLAEDAADAIRPQIETALLLEDRLTAIEFERLLRATVANGIAVETSRTLVLRLAREIGVAVETGAAVDYVVCALCNTANPIAGSEARCDQCGAELYRKCPKCAAPVARVAAACKSCHYDLGALRHAEQSIAEAQAALSSGAVNAAAILVDQLASWAGDIDAVGVVRQAVNAARSRAQDDWAKVHTLVSQGRLDDAAVAARGLVQTAHDVPDTTGRLPEDVVALITEDLNRIAASVAETAVLAGPAREDAVLGLASQFPSNAAVLAALRQLPVTAPSGVLAMVAGDVVRVSWKASPSSGDVTYRVSRLQHGPDGPTARSIGSTPDTSVEDAGAPAGSLVSYEVQAMRHGIPSGKVGTRTQLVAFEVSRLVAVEHDGSVELRWTRLTGHSGIWVERTDTTDPTQAALRARASDNGWMDTNVVDGHRYSYRVFVEYGTGTDRTTTRGVTVTAAAFAVPPAPIVRFADSARGTVAMRVESTSSAVVVRCSSSPTAEPGSIVDARSLSRLGQVLTPDPTSSVTDHVDGQIRWYVPAATFGSQAVIGAPVVHTGLAEPAGLTATATPSDVVLRWTWPAGCTETVIAWRAGTAPLGVDDPQASTGKITNTSYELHDGWHLKAPTAGELFFLLRPSRRVGGELIPTPGGSTAARVNCTYQQLPAVSYQLRRVGRRKKELQVELTGQPQGLARLLVVAEPLGTHDAVESPRILGEVAPGYSSVVVPLEGLPLPALISLRTDEHSAPLTIRDPDDEARTIR